MNDFELIADICCVCRRFLDTRKDHFYALSRINDSPECISVHHSCLNELIKHVKRLGYKEDE